MSLFSRNSDGVATLVALLVATACQEPQRTAGPAAVARPSLAISDGAHSGLGQFLWLPPMVPNPKDTGTFDPTVLPVVRICEWTGAACVGDPIATFTTTTGPNGETVALDLIDSLYQVDWHTDQFNLPLGSTYRVSVSSGPWLIGYADILMVGPGQVKNASNGNDVPMVDGKTLPIKFRVDRGLNPDFSMSQVSSGSGPACGVSPSGTAFCWGVNYYGALGNGTAALYNGVWSNTVQWLPTEVVGGLQFATIAAGFVSSCGLTTDGSAWCWGSNTTGQLGNGSNSDSKVPVAVSGGLRFVSITASQYSGDARDDKLGTACGVAIGGSLYCWGNNSFGQLGTGSYVSSNVPVPAAGGLTFASVSLGENHACGLTVTGAAYCWGDNSSGELGNGANVNTSAPVPVSGGLTFSSISAGGSNGGGVAGFTCGVTIDGAGYCWGAAGDGTLGDGSNAEMRVPTPVLGGLRFSSISAGQRSACGVTTSGAGYCWGWNDYGQLGTGEVTQPSHSTPAPVAGGLTFVSISVGSNFACGVAVGSVAYCWGPGGLLGNGTGTGSLVPLRVGTL